MNKLICDSFPAPARFSKEELLSIIITEDNDITSSVHHCSEIGCCSEVRGTFNNWFYMINKNTINEQLPLLSSWIDELASVFPELELKIINVPELLLVLGDGMNMFTTTNIKNIKVELPLSPFTTRNYNTLNINNSKTAKFSDFKHLSCQLYMYVINYLFTLKEVNLSEEVVSVIVNKFYKDEFENLISRLKKADSYDFALAEIIYQGHPFRHEIDVMSIDWDDFIIESAFKEYFKQIILINTRNLQKLFNTKVERSVPCIQALYSNPHPGKRGVTSYIVHILIRAVLLAQGVAFVKQYFYIKEKTPDICFWNRILLTQFGFEFSYYYWLTPYRTFRFTTDEKFTGKLKSCQHTSANSFFSDHFYWPCSIKVREELQKLYLKEDFKEFIKICSAPYLVTLRPEYKNKFSQLRLSKDYLITETGDSVYSIAGDNYKIRKYLKTYFIPHY